MEPRIWRMLVALTVMLVLALAGFTLMLRRYQRELVPAPGNRSASRLVRPPGAPPLPAHVLEHMEKQGIVTERAHEATLAVTNGVGQVDPGGGSVP